MFLSKPLVVVFLGGLVFCTHLQAHPHNWISLESDFLVDASGQLTGIQQRWEFDPFYSMISIADARNEHGDLASALGVLADTMATNLAEYHYFSHLYKGQNSIALPMPDHQKLRVLDKQGQQILQLELHFSFASPPVVSGQTLKWQVYDPSYYIAMLHKSSSAAQIVGAGSALCQTHLDQPSPSNELIAYATGLDRNERDTDGLGQHFAETVQITCAEESLSWNNS